MTKIQIISEEVDLNDFDDSKLPSDVHLITYKEGDSEVVHAVRAYTKVDIFDHYYDKLKSKAQILSIKSGFGKIRPNLYGKIKGDES